MVEGSRNGLRHRERNSAKRAQNFEQLFENNWWPGVVLAPDPEGAIDPWLELGSLLLLVLVFEFLCAQFLFLHFEVGVKLPFVRVITLEMDVKFFRCLSFRQTATATSCVLAISIMLASSTVIILFNQTSMSQRVCALGKGATI